MTGAYAGPGVQDRERKPAAKSNTPLSRGPATFHLTASGPTLLPIQVRRQNDQLSLTQMTLFARISFALDPVVFARKYQIGVPTFGEVATQKARTTALCTPQTMDVLYDTLSGEIVAPRW